jgi:hypothetical protein
MLARENNIGRCNNLAQTDSSFPRVHKEQEDYEKQ